MKVKRQKCAIVAEVVEPLDLELYSKVREIISVARQTVYVAANAAMVAAYWNVGREIVEKQGGRSRAKYGDCLMQNLAEKLTAEFGAGYIAANLFNMRQFYLAFPKFNTLCRELSWSHYRTLMRIEDSDARQYYLEECAKSKWSVRILQRQIASLYYERLLRNKADPKSLRAPGRGFALDAEQKRLPIGDEIYSCDLVFYNYLARCFFLIDLKVGKVTPQDIGQMQLYKHYYEQEMMNPGDNPPVGVVLGSDADSAVVKYTLNEHERNLFAVKYHLSLPTVDEIRQELQRERAAIEDAMRLRELSQIQSHSKKEGKAK